MRVRNRMDTRTGCLGISLEFTEFIFMIYGDFFPKNQRDLMYIIEYKQNKASSLQSGQVQWPTPNNIFVFYVKMLIHLFVCHCLYMFRCMKMLLWPERKEGILTILAHYSAGSGKFWFHAHIHVCSMAGLLNNLCDYALRCRYSIVVAIGKVMKICTWKMRHTKNKIRDK